MTRSAGHSPVRGVVIGICGLVVALLFAAVVRQSWADTRAAAEVVHLEEGGAATLHPMLTLLSNLVEAQSTAVRGERVDTEAVRKAVRKVAEPSNEYGQTLQIGQRLTDLTSHIETAFAKGDTGRAAYDSYSSMVDLTLEMIRRIGDISHLIHDPDIDSYYLMDSAIIRLPDAIVYAGRASDLVALAGGKVLAGEDQVRTGVARFTVAFDAEQVTTGLTKSVDFTARSQLSTNIADRLDAFKGAADAFAPPTMLAELATTVDAATLAANARKVYAAAQSLAHLLLSELQALLDVRASKLAQQQKFTGIAVAIAVIVGLAMLWFAVAGRPRRAPSRRFGSSVDDLPVGSLAYARDLLESSSEDLASAGRGRTRGSDNAL